MTVHEINNKKQLYRDEILGRAVLLSEGICMEENVKFL